MKEIWKDVIFLGKKWLRICQRPSHFSSSPQKNWLVNIWVYQHN